MGLELSKRAVSVKASSTLAITAKAKELKANGIDIVGFGAGEPDFNTPDNINKAGHFAIDNGITKYTPASGTIELKKAISEKFKRFNNLSYDTNQIVISNGGKHSLTNVFQAIINEGDEVIIPAPYWLTYPEIVKLCGGVPVILETTKEENFKLNIDKLKALVTKKTKALVLNTPSNPTGMVYKKDELEKIAKVAIDYDFYVVSDEMYENLIYSKEPHISIASLGEEIYKRTITCSGMSKAYAMTGWRIGYTGSSGEIAKVMGSIQSHETSNPNSIAQYASVEALNGDQSIIEEMKGEFNKRRLYMKERLENMDYIDPSTPEGAFYFFVDFSKVLGRDYNGKKIESINEVGEILLNDYHIAVVPCGDFGCENYIRFSYAISIDTIKKGMDRLENFLRDIK